MRITRRQLRRLIKEELEHLTEVGYDRDVTYSSDVSDVRLGAHAAGGALAAATGFAAQGIPKTAAHLANVSRGAYATAGAAEFALAALPIALYVAGAGALIATISHGWYAWRLSSAAKKHSISVLLASTLQRAVTNNVKAGKPSPMTDDGWESMLYHVKKLLSDETASPDQQLTAMKEFGIGVDALIKAYDQVEAGMTEEHYLVSEEERAELREKLIEAWSELTA